MPCNAITTKNHSCENEVFSCKAIVRNEMIYCLCEIRYDLNFSALLLGLDQARGRKLNGRWARIGNVLVNIETYEVIEQLHFALSSTQPLKHTAN